MILLITSDGLGPVQTVPIWHLPEPSATPAETCAGGASRRVLPPGPFGGSNRVATGGAGGRGPQHPRPGQPRRWRRALRRTAPRSNHRRRPARPEAAPHVPEGAGAIGCTTEWQLLGQLLARCDGNAQDDPPAPPRPAPAEPAKSPVAGCTHRDIERALMDRMRDRFGW